MIANPTRFLEQWNLGEALLNGPFGVQGDRKTFSVARDIAALYFSGDTFTSSVVTKNSAVNEMGTNIRQL